MDVRELVLAAGLRLVDALAPRLPSRRAAPAAAPDAPPPAATDGVAILIPERGTPALLAACLDSVAAACAGVVEPVAVVVVVNGCERAAYDALVARHGAVRWTFEPRPLGFGGAIARGLALVGHDWVYLLNSDMTLDPGALAALLPLRDARTFAVASQIFLADPARRREETGWTDFRIEGRVTQHYDRTPEGDAVRGHLYAGGGASLFRTALLRRYAARTRAYAPFYFEDADWGVQAAREGLAVKFCPASRAWHRHRATIGRCYEPAEIARIVRRNELLFEARHGFGGRARMLAGVPASTRRELTTPATLATTLWSRWRTRRARARGYAPELCCATWHPHHFDDARPTRMFAVGTPLPREPAAALHRFLAHAAAAQAEANLVLVIAQFPGDPALDAPSLEAFAAVHVVPAAAGNAGDGSPLARPGDPEVFARQLAWWREVYRPAAVSTFSATGDPDLRPARAGAPDASTPRYATDSTS